MSADNRKLYFRGRFKQGNSLMYLKVGIKIFTYMLWHENAIKLNPLHYILRLEVWPFTFGYRREVIT